MTYRLSEFRRTLKINLKGNNATFLWGPRKVGKPTLLRQQFPHAAYYDLLEASPDKSLESYILDYIEQEIAAEALTRQIPSFSKFLEGAALTHGRLINYANIARESASLPKRLIETEKFYLFDVGVVRALSGMRLISAIQKFESPWPSGEPVRDWKSISSLARWKWPSNLKHPAGWETRRRPVSAPCGGSIAEACGRAKSSDG